MILTRLETDYYQKGVSLQDIDISDDNLVKILEENNPLFLIHVYRDKGYSKKALKLLRKFIRKKGRDNYIEQFILTCIHFKEYDLAHTSLKAHNKSTFVLDKYKIFLTILKNEQNYEMKNLGEKYKKVIKNLSEGQKNLLIDFINTNKEVYLKMCSPSLKGSSYNGEREYLSVFKYGLNFLRNKEYKYLCDLRHVKKDRSSMTDSLTCDEFFSCSLPIKSVTSQEKTFDNHMEFPSTLPNSLSEEDFIYKNLYKYDCSSNKEVMTTLISYIKTKYDNNVVFIYLHILNTSCILNKCKKNCVGQGYEELKKIILNEKYLNNLGYKDLKNIYEIYKHDSILDRMYEMNVFMEDELKELYFQSSLCDIKKIENHLQHIFHEKDYNAYIKMKKDKLEEQKDPLFIEYARFSHSNNETLSPQEIIDRYKLDMVACVPELEDTFDSDLLKEFRNNEPDNVGEDFTCYSGITPDGKVIPLIDCTPDESNACKKKVVNNDENIEPQRKKTKRKVKMRSSYEVEFSDTLINKENSIISNKTLYNSFDENHNNKLLTFNGIKFTKPVRETLFKEKEAKSYDEMFTADDFNGDECDISTKIKNLQEKLDEIKKQ